MNGNHTRISTVAQLLDAVNDASLRSIEVEQHLSEVPTIKLAPGQKLAGSESSIALRFALGQDGLQLSSDNQVEGLELSTDPDRRALFNDTSVERIGRLVLKDLRITGVVQLLARDRVRGGHVEAENVDIVAADARGWQAPGCPCYRPSAGN